MRASTLLALFIAVMIGFAALASARYFGLFKGSPPVAKAEVPKVLVAKSPLFKGIAMMPDNVQVRELQADEMQEYLRDPGKYLPATVDAATLRVPNRDITAGSPLLKEYLDPQGLPDGIGERLTPGMQAVHVSVSKEFASGGLIRVGEHVNVLLTCKITGNGNGQPVVSKTASVPIAFDLPVLFKRDLLYTVLVPVPKNDPIQFTLEANPYRAALIEFAKDKGQLTLVPVPNKLLSKDGKVEAPKTFSDPSSPEYKNEDDRIAAIRRGDRSVGDADLERIFGLPPLPLKEQLNIQMMHGNKVKGVEQFIRYVDLAERPPVNPDQPGYGYHFSNPFIPAEPAPASGRQIVNPTRPAIKTK